MTQANAFTGIPRSEMPQIKDIERLKELLDLSGIEWEIIEQDPFELHPIQTEVDDEKVHSLMKFFSSIWSSGGRDSDWDLIITSSDKKVLDGQHRHAAAKNLGRRAITTLEIAMEWKIALAWLKSNT